LKEKEKPSIECEEGSSDKNEEKSRA